MTTPDPLALAEEALRNWAQDVPDIRARYPKRLALDVLAALRAAHEENARLVTQAAELGKWRDAVLNAAVVDWTYRKEHETDPVRAVNDLVCYALDVEREALRKENQRLREATGGLMPPRCASLVEVSNEMAAQLLGEPSQPVTIRLERRADGRVELLCARHECTPTPEPPHA